MYALIDKASNTVAAFTTDPSGYDLSLYNVVAAPAGSPGNWVWNGAQFVARPPTAAEVTANAMEGDARWQALRTATPAQVSAWLNANVTDLASTREVLRILVLALQRVLNTR